MMKLHDVKRRRKSIFFQCPWRDFPFFKRLCMVSHAFVCACAFCICLLLCNRVVSLSKFAFFRLFSSKYSCFSYMETVSVEKRWTTHTTWTDILWLSLLETVARSSSSSQYSNNFKTNFGSKIIIGRFGKSKK